MLTIKKIEIIKIYSSNLGIEGATDLINKAIINQNMSEKDEFTIEEINEICFYIQKLSPLLKSITQAYQIQIERNFRKKIEQAWWNSENRFVNLIEAIPDIVYFKDTEGRYLFINKTFEQVTGLNRHSIINSNDNDDEIFPLLFTENDEIVLKQKKSVSYEEICHTKSGHEIALDTIKVPLFDKKNNLSGLVGISRDITEKKQLEKELQKSRNLESIGLLAGGIAHDFNNILTAIVGNISFARILCDSADSNSELSNTLNDAEKACIKAKGLTQQLLTFAKGGAPLKKTESIYNIVKDTAEFVVRGSSVKIEYSQPKDLWFVDADSGQISQVINNLIINAMQSMPGGGRIKIGFHNINVSPDQNLSLDKGRYVKIVIEDEGEGISDSIISKIFDPYFTTKPNGSGLGLATTYSIIKRHNGQIMAESTIGKGSIFTIHLPATSGNYNKKRKIAAAARKSPAKILVMDDEKMILNTTGKLLRFKGYQIESAENGKDAAEKYKAAFFSGDPFNIAILDLTIPGGMGGVETVEKLMQIDPYVKAIASSGYTNDPVMSDYTKFGFSGIACKPYIIDELCEIIESILIER
jgi:PAS domain S-box-containing protein